MTEPVRTRTIRNKTIRTWLPGDPPNLDPQAGVDEWSLRLHAGMFEGLFRPLPDGGIGPGLATGHRVSADGLTVDLTLRPGAAWSDGRPVTAHDVVFAAERALDPGNGLRAAWQWYIVRNGRERHQGLDAAAPGVEALSEHTLRLHLAEPLSYLPELLALPPLAPLRADMAPQSRSPAELAEWALSTPVSGPLRLADIRVAQRYTLEPNQRHWDDRVSHAPVEYLIGGDPVARFETGEIDLAPVGYEQAARVAGDRVRFVTESTAVSLVLNTAREELREQRRRDAIAGSIDRGELVRLASPMALPLHRMVPGSAGCDEYLRSHHVDGPAPRPSRAALAGERFTLSCGDQPEQLRQAAVLAEQIAGAGCDVTVQPLPYSQLYWRVRRSEHQLALVAWRADFDHPLGFLREHTSDGAAGNQSKWSDTRYNEVVGRARRSIDPAQCYALLAEAEQRILDYHGVLPLCQPRRPWLVNPELRHVVFRAAGVSPDLRWAMR